MKHWGLIWRAIILLSALSIGLLTTSHTNSPLRPVITFWFLFICPGMALVRLLDLTDRLEELILATALSLALDASVAGTMLYAHVWSFRWGVIVLIGISVGGVMLQILTDYWSRTKRSTT
jgi:uncharacterized membrane protein